MNFRLASRASSSTWATVDELAGIRRERRRPGVGAMTRLAEWSDPAEVAMAAPLVAEAAGLRRAPPIRNRGTVVRQHRPRRPGGRAARRGARARRRAASSPARPGPAASRPRTSCRGRSPRRWAGRDARPRSAARRCRTAGTRSPSTPGSTPTSPSSRWRRCVARTGPDRARRAGADRGRPDRDPRRRGRAGPGRCRRRRRTAAAAADGGGGRDSRPPATCTAARRPGSRWPVPTSGVRSAGDLPRAEREVRPWHRRRAPIELTVNGDRG